MLSCLNETQIERVIGEKGFSISIPAEMRKSNKWRIHTRFSYAVDPEQHQLILAESEENGANQISLLGSRSLKINCNMCNLLGWKAGDTILIKFDDKKIILRRIKKGREIKKKLVPEIVGHAHRNGHFPLFPDRQICKNNRWGAGTLFAYKIQEGKTILEESKAVTLKISEYNGRISISTSICKAAGLLKGDPVRTDYEGKKIIMRRGD